MNKRRGCSRPIAVAFSLLAVLACVALGVSGLVYYRLQRARAQNEPPSVMITDPAEGASTLADSYMGVSAMAFGGIPITRAELWLDGELVDTEETSIEGGVSPFYVSFELLVSQGLHSVFVRAVNAAGLIGDSWPVGIGGVERPGPDDPARLVTVAEGQTLEDIATTYDVNPQTVQQLNPDLGGQQPPAGSTVVLPPPQSKTQPGPGGTPPVGPTTPGGPSVGPTIPVGPPVGPAIPPGGLTVTGTTPLLPIGPGGLVGAVVDLWATAAPAAPTGLKAEVTDCTVRLSWNDNANNEARYEVWYTWDIFGSPRLIAKLNPAKGGQVWYELDMGWGTYIFWVEAVNAVGRQKSAPAAALVSRTDCAQSLATHLQVEALDMTVPAGYNQLYCYVSFEGAQHVRVPAGINDFIQVTVGKGNISPWASGNKKLVVPIPADESLDVEGYCWGWSGGKLSQFGTFGGKYPRSTWDGQRRALPGNGFQIGLSIKPLGGALDTSGLTTLYSYDDPTLPVPYEVRENKIPGASDPLLRSLSWKYDNPKNVTITGFQIFLNGVPYSPGGGWTLIGPTGRSAEVRLPKDCGMHIAWQIRAIAGEARSKPSALKPPENSYDLPKCPEPVYVMVKFWDIIFEDNCTDLDLYWSIRLNGETKHYYDSCDMSKYNVCNGDWPHLDDPHPCASEWDFPYSSCCPSPLLLPQDQDLLAGTLVAQVGTVTSTPVGPSGGVTTTLATGNIDFEIEAKFWNTLRSEGDQEVGYLRAVYHFASLQEAQQQLGACHQPGSFYPGQHDPDAVESEARHAWITYTIYLFPAPAGSNCGPAQPAYIP